MIDQLTSIMREQFKNPELELSRELTADDVAGWDSLAHVHLIIAVEEAFGVRFRSVEVGRLKNVGDLMDLIAKKQK